MRRASTAPDFVGGTHNKPRASRLISLPSRAMGVSEGDAGSGGDTGWDALGLDPRLLRALTKKRYRAPTPVQARAIPLVLAGKDVVARAHTGSGKTAAYLLPAIHKIMQSDVSGAPAPNPRALVLVPTRELAHQVKKEAAFILGKCAPEKRAGELPASGCASGVLREFAGAPPEVLVATPARVAECVRDGLFPPDALRAGLELLVLDEADLLLSFGYEDNIRAVVQAVHRGCQCMLLSATSGGDELARLQALVLHHPVHLDVGDDASAKRSGENRSGESGANAEDAPSNAVGPRVSHAVVKCPAKDKLLYVMALLRLGLCQSSCVYNHCRPRW
jgi:ATP-dependent RNA helicase DDX56/DBP9